MFARAYLARRSPVPLYEDTGCAQEQGDCNGVDELEHQKRKPLMGYIAMARAHSTLAILPWLFGLGLCVVLDGVATVAAVFGVVIGLAALVLLAVSLVVSAPAWGPAAWRWRRAWADPLPPV